MDSWLKDAYIICSYGKGNRKKPQKDAEYVQPEDNRETRIAKREKVKNNRFKHELKMTFLFNFEIFKVETLGKDSGASSHTWQLQEKI